MVSSYNGWTANPKASAIGVVPFKISGVDFPGGVKGGDVAVVLGYVAEQFFKRVEKAVVPGCWGFNYRPNRNNPNNLSCHASGTAIDLNAPKHPNGQFPTFTARQVTEMRLILAEVDHVVAWGYDFSHTKDPMHVEIATGKNAAAVKKVADKIRALHSTVVPSKIATVKIAQPADPRLHLGTKDLPNAHRVTDVQTALVNHGYNIKVDGDFGPGTDRALRIFQAANKLNPDGITWASTWKALRDYTV